MISFTFLETHELIGLIRDHETASSGNYSLLLRVTILASWRTIFTMFVLDRNLTLIVNVNYYTIRISELHLLISWLINFTYFIQWIISLGHWRTRIVRISHHVNWICIMNGAKSILWLFGKLILHHHIWVLESKSSIHRWLHFFEPFLWSIIVSRKSFQILRLITSINSVIRNVIFLSTSPLSKVWFSLLLLL